MSFTSEPFTVFVGSGGVGKTTLAAALGLSLADAGHDTLVMTFDPSLRLKDALGVGDEARDREVRVDTQTAGRLDASLLDARRAFDRLVDRYAPDEAARQRILNNRYYQHLAGHLSGILEYMAVERLFEVAEEGRYDRVVLDTPPTRQALDFLEAPQRIVAFLDSGALKIALKPWFDDSGHLKLADRWWGLGQRLEKMLDRLIGLSLLRDMAEFFQAFEPLYEGFRERALKVETLLRSPQTRFVVVAAPGAEAVPDTMFLSRRLEEAGYHLGPMMINRVHPRGPAIVDWVPTAEGAARALELFRWLGERDGEGIDQLRSLNPGRELLSVPLLPEAPTDLASLLDLGRRLTGRGALA